MVMYIMCKRRVFYITMGMYVTCEKGAGVILL